MLADISKTGPNISGNDVLKEAVNNLLNTSKFSSFFNRGLYGTLEDLLFSPATFVGSRMIRSELTTLVKTQLAGRIDDVIINVKAVPESREYEVDINLIVGESSIPIKKTYPTGGGNGSN